MTVYGVDISSWQQGLDLSRVAKEGYPAVMVKATQGSDYVNPLYRGHRDQARTNGMLFAAYHYVDIGDPAGQAANLHNVVDDTSVPIMIDAENGSGNIDNILSVIRAIQALGYRILCTYIPDWYWENIGSPSLRDLPGPLMSSDYGNGSGGRGPGYGSALYPGDTNVGWNSYGGKDVAIFQFTQKATVAGQNIDAWAFRGTLDELKSFFWEQKPSTPGVIVGDKEQLIAGAAQWADPHGNDPARGVIGPRPQRRPEGYNVAGNDPNVKQAWGRAMLMDLWNEMVFDGYESRTPLDPEPGSLVDFVLRTHKLTAEIHAAVTKGQTS